MIKAFTKHNPKYERPEEDSFGYEVIDGKIIIAVADGITRDLVDGKYPEPSPARVAADLFCGSFIEHARYNGINENSVRESLAYSNSQIKYLNRGLKVDYLQNDFFACVGIGGVVADRKLYYGFVADCGVCVFDEKGKLKFRTQNEGPNSKGSIDNEVRKKYDTNFSEQKGRKIIRSLYRNNPDEHLSYGAFTGEEKAMSFVRSGSFNLSDGDYVIFYSDGFAQMLYSDGFSISKEFDRLENYFDVRLDKIDGSGGTVVALRMER